MDHLDLVLYTGGGRTPVSYFIYAYLVGHTLFGEKDILFPLNRLSSLVENLWTLRARQMARELRKSVYCSSRGIHSVPSTHVRWLTIARNSRPGIL